MDVFTALEFDIPELLKRNLVGWFEIPILDSKRAVSFYEYVLTNGPPWTTRGELTIICREPSRTGCAGPVGPSIVRLPQKRS